MNHILSMNSALLSFTTTGEDYFNSCPYFFYQTFSKVQPHENSAPPKLTINSVVDELESRKPPIAISKVTLLPAKSMVKKIKQDKGAVICT